MLHSSVSEIILESQQEGVRKISLSYDVFCNQINAGSSYIDADQWYFNFINFIPCVKGKEQEPVELHIDFPDAFKYYSALKRKENYFYASSYYELVDAPFLASRFLEIHSFILEGTVFNLAVNNTEQIELPWEKLEKDFSAFALPQKALFGSFPFKEFTYLIYLLPYKAYHGVEHKDCTVITIGPSEKALYGDWYKELLGVSSHELFHCWNVTRLRPVEMLPNDFSRQQIHNTGFVTEGFTTYYGDLMLARSGVFSPQDYLEEINTYLKRYVLNPAYTEVSMIESSIRLWANGYKPGPPFNHVSIYIKGALLALLLDLKLRKQDSSLDELMQFLWEVCREVGYTFKDVIYFINKLVPGMGETFSKKYYEGLEDVISELKTEMEAFGLEMYTEPHENDLTHKFGILINPENKVLYVDPASALAEQVLVGDLIKEQKESGLEVERMGIKREIIFKAEKESSGFFAVPKVRFIENRTSEQNKYLEDWLKVKML